MTLSVSPVVPTHRHAMSGFAGLHRLDLRSLGVAGAPLVMVDDFRVGGLPFAPHPHAGFAAVTYVFTDSPTGLRSRSSLGDDVVVGPGGIVWSEAGSGLLHEESPADAEAELHGVQLFVKLSAANELTPPRMPAVDAAEIPEWRDAHGGRVRVVVGSHDGVSSPLELVEPFTLLDVDLRHEVTTAVPAAQNVVVYARTGALELRVEGRSVRLVGSTTVALGGDAEADADVTLVAHEPSQVLVLGGPALAEPVVADGPFIMSSRERIADAFRRFQSGAMGSLAPSTPVSRR